MNQETARSLIQPISFQGASSHAMVRSSYTAEPLKNPSNHPQDAAHVLCVYCTISHKSNGQILLQALLFFNEQVISLHLGTCFMKTKNEAFVFLRKCS